MKTGGMSDTIRPHLDAELVAEIDDVVREHIRIPPDRLPVGDRLGVLLEEYQDLVDRVESLEGKVERQEAQIDELQENLADARAQHGPSGLRQ
jgi:chaperonin cofactor prefoldin